MNEITKITKLYNWIVYGHGGEIGIVLVASFCMATGILTSWLLYSGILLSAALIYFNIGRPKGARNK